MKEDKKTCCCKEECNCEETCNCEEDCNCGCDCKEDCDCKCNCDDECNCEDKCCCSHELKNDKKNDKKKKKDKISELEEKLSKTIEMLKIAQDGMVRSQAELINYRKRKDDEVSKLLLYCNESIVKELLPTLDNFERAIKLDDDNLEDALSKFLDGFKMIYCSMVGTLEKYGVKAIDSSNVPFDPKLHQAVLMEQRDDVESGTVLEVLQKGYLLKDRVIRPAMVRVSE